MNPHKNSTNGLEYQARAQPRVAPNKRITTIMVSGKQRVDAIENMSIKYITD